MNNIRMAILNADNQCVAHLDNSLEDSLHYYNDSFVDYLEGAAGVFTFTAPAKHPESQYLIEGNKIAFNYQDKDRYYTIVKAQPSEYTVDITAYSLCLDLINEQSPAYEAPSAMTFAQYLAVFCDEDYLVINRNEVAGKSIQHKWEGTSTLLARLYSLATVFSAEIEFLPILRQDYSLERIEVNVYAAHDETHQGIGEARQDIVMQYGVNVKSIRKTSDITNLYTSIYATGKDGITISSISRTVTDANGDVLYFTESGSPVLYAKQARDRYPSSISEDGGYIQYSPGEETEYETAEALYGYMLGRLKIISQPAVSYEVDGYEALNVGDTVLIKDEEFNPPLYLAARVAQQKWSVTQPEQNKTTFDNFTEYVISNTAAPSSSAPVDIVARAAAKSAALAAYNARIAAATADTKAVAARGVADTAKASIDAQVLYFWHDATGAYVSNVAGSTSGKHLKLTSSAIQLKSGNDVLAEFGPDQINLLAEIYLQHSTTEAGELESLFKRVADGETGRQVMFVGMTYESEIAGHREPYIQFRVIPSDDHASRVYINGDRIVLNGYDAVSVRSAHTSSPIGSNGSYMAFNRFGSAVQATVFLQGPLAAGVTSWQGVIPEGFRPSVGEYTPSTKAMSSNHTSMTNTSEGIVRFNTDGSASVLVNAAFDGNWRLEFGFMYLTGDDWPAS